MFYQSLVASVLGRAADPRKTPAGWLSERLDSLVTVAEKRTLNTTSVKVFNHQGRVN